MAREALRGRGFRENQKKSFSGYLTALLLLLLLGSLGLSIYIYQDNKRLGKDQYLIETLEYEYGLLDKEKAALEKGNRDLEEKNNELEGKLQILVNVNNKLLTADDAQGQDQKELSEITLLLNTLKKDKDELNVKVAVLEKTINSKNSEILDLQAQLTRLSNQLAALSNEADDLIVNSDYMLIDSVQPQYPRRALSRGMTGWVVVEFTVTEQGTVRNPFIVENCGWIQNMRKEGQCVDNPNTVFDSSAIKAALKFKYKPKVIDGNPVPTAGVQNKITFELVND